MALTRKMLKAMGIEEDKIEQIIEAHAESTDALKEERNSLKENAEKLPQVQRELDDLKKSISEDNKESYKVKYEAIKEEFANFKKQQNEKETKEQKTAAFKKLLKEINISNDTIEDIVDITNFDKIELDENGSLKDIDKLKENYTEKYHRWIETKKTEGAKVDMPPANSGAGNGKTKEEIFKNPNTEERLRDIAANPHLFPELNK